MKILLGEMRRYWPPLTLVICGALVMMWYGLYGENFNLQSQNNYSQPYLLSIEYHRRYGDSIDSAKLEEIKAQHAEERAALDQLYDEFMGQYGLHSKDDFDLLREAEDPDNEAYAEAISRWGKEGLAEKLEYLPACMDIAWSEPLVSAIFREQSIRLAINRCEMADDARQAIDTNVSESDWFFGGMSDHVKARLKASLDEGEVSLTNAVYDVDDFSDFFYWNILITILCAVVALPLPLRNKLTGVKGMQLAAKTGKAIVRQQFAAAFISGVLVNLTVDGFFFGTFFFGKGNTRHLLGCRLNAGALGNSLWPDLTYLEFVLLCFFLTLLLSLAAVCVLFAIACLSPNYIVGMTAAIPCVVLQALCFRQMIRQLYLCYGSAILFTLLLMAALTAAAAAILLLTRRVKREEYQN